MDPQLFHSAFPKGKFIRQLPMSSDLFLCSCNIRVFNKFAMWLSAKNANYRSHEYLWDISATREDYIYTRHQLDVLLSSEVNIDLVYLLKVYWFVTEGSVQLLSLHTSEATSSNCIWSASSFTTKSQAFLINDTDINWWSATDCIINAVISSNIYIQNPFAIYSQ